MGQKMNPNGLRVGIIKDCRFKTFWRISSRRSQNP